MLAFVRQACVAKCDKVFQVFYTFCCLVSIFSITSYLILSYTDNYDSSKISFKEFNAAPGGRYPMISICIVTYTNLVNSNLSPYINLNATYYQKILLGISEGTNNILSNYDFDNVTLHLQHYVDSILIENLNNEKVDSWQQNINNSNSIPFYKSY